MKNIDRKRPRALVFFCKARERPIARVARAAIRARRRRIAGMIPLIAAIRILTRSPIVHVAIAVGEVAHSPEKRGDVLWPTVLFIRDYPNLAYVIDLRLARPIQLTTRNSERPWLPSLLRWITMGLYPADDCVQSVSATLRAGGVPVPGRITTPVQLFTYLKERGHRVRAF